ncbi:MAG: sugar ABC transporter substrate-binding protein [Chloroflexi bacterium]|nr:sugar ABC transporter substrate-binding protein [Chloroflexota bacterium]
MKNKWFVTVSLLSIAALALAACAPSATATPTTAPTTAAATSVPVTGPTTAPTTASTAAATTAATTAATAVGTAAATATPPPTPTPAPTVPAAQLGSCPLTNLEAGATITFSGWGDPSEQSVYRDSIVRFNEVCPGVTVNYNPIPTNFQTKLKAEMAAGTAPDVFYVDDQLMPAFAPAGQLMPLNSLMQEAGVQASSFIPQLLQEFTLNGQYYALPKDWGTLGLIYLPEAFQAAGIPEPTANWTFQDMAQAALTISQKTKYKGFCQAPDWARFAAWAFSYGGSYTSPDFKTATLDSPQILQAATLLDQMIQNKSLVQPSDVGASWCGDAIGKQLVAMTLEGGWLVPFMAQTYPNVTYKAVILPSGPAGKADVIFTNGIGVNAATKYPRAAAAFDFFVTGEINQLLIQNTGFAYSTHPDEISKITDPIDLAISSGGLLPKTQVAYYGPYTGAFETVITNALSRIYLKAQTVDQAFAQAQQDGQATLNGQGQ